MPGILWIFLLPPSYAFVPDELSGVVRDRMDAVISDAEVVLRSPERVPIRRTSTDALGRFSFQDVPAGSYELVVSHPGFRNRHYALDTREGRPGPLEITLEIQSLESRVTVTARRGMVEETSEVARSVNVIAEEEIRDRARTVVAQIANEEPGVHLQRTSPSLAGIYVRGLTGSKVNVFVDGIRYSTAAARGGINTFLDLVEPPMLEAAEILRGPTSAEYGSGALGGSIQFLTRSPRTSATGLPVPRGWTETTFDTSDMSFGSNLMASYSAGSFGVIASASGRRVNTLRTGGGRDSHSAVTRFFGIDSSEAHGSRLPDTAFSQYGGTLKVLWIPTEDARITALYMRGQQDGGKRYDHLLGGDGNLKADLRNLMLDLAYLKFEKSGVAGFDHVTASYSFNSQREERVNQGGNGDPDALVIHEYERLSAHGFQAHGDRKWLRRQYLRIGAEFQYEGVRAPAFGLDPRTGSAAPRRPRIPDRARYASGGAYVENIFDLIPDRVRLAGSVRHSIASYRSRREDSPLLGGVSLWPSDSLRVSDTTFEFSGVVDAGGGFSIAANVSRGFRAPQMTDLGTLGLTGAGFEVSAADLAGLDAFVGTTAGADAVSTGIRASKLRPEKSLSFETGIRFRTRRVRADVVFFANHLEDVITKQALILPPGAVGLEIGGVRIAAQSNGGALFVSQAGNPVLVRSNLQAARILGLEHGLRWMVSPSWALHAAMTYLHARDSASGRPPNIEGGTPAPDFHLKVRFSPPGSRFSIEPYLHGAGRQSRLSSLDLEDRRIGATRSRNGIRSFFYHGATARGLVDPGPDGRFGTVDDTLKATGETVEEIQRRVLGPGIDAVPLFRAVAGYVTFNLRARAALRERHELQLDFENIGDANYRGVSWGLDGAGRGVLLRYRLSF